MADTTTNIPARPMDRALPKAWWRRRRFQISAIVIAIVVTGTAIAMILPPPGTVTVAGSSMDTGTVVHAAFQDYVPLRSAVVPLTTVYVTAQTAGHVVGEPINDGELVTEGQVLAHLANPDLTLEVSSREADISGRLSDTNSQLMNLQTQQQSREQTTADVAYALHKAEEDLSRHQMLLSHGILNEAAIKPYADEVIYQRARLAKLTASQSQEAAFYRTQHDQILSSAGDLRRSLGEARQGLEALAITAPVAGRLTDFELKPGQAVKQGDPLGEVDSEGTYKLRAQVDEYYLARLATGLTAQANVHGETREVHISKVFPQVADGRVTVEMEFNGAMPAGLKRGEAIDVRLSLGATQPAVLAPAGTWLNDSNGAYAFVLNAQGDRADRRSLSIGRRNPEFVEILSGLKPGERIVVNGTQSLTKAQHIRLTKSNAQ